MEMGIFHGGVYHCIGMGIDFCCLSDRRIVFMTWDWQEWVVALLIVLCVARMVYGIYNFFAVRKIMKILVQVAQVAVN